MAEGRLFHIDELKYEDYADQTLTLKGWFDQGEYDWRAVLSDGEGEPLELPLEHGRRPDVAKNYPDLLHGEDSGISIRIPKAWELAGREGTYRVFMQRGDGGERVELFAASSADLHSLLSGQLLTWKIDQVRLISHILLSVQGWVLCQRGEWEIQVTDPHGRVLPARVELVERQDVQESFHLPADFSQKPLGFGISLDAGKVKSKRILVKVRGAGQERSFPIDLASLRARETAAGRIRETFAWKNRHQTADILRDRGVHGFVQYVKEEAGVGPRNYQQFCLSHRPGRQQLQRQSRRSFPISPLLSIVVPLYNTPESFLKALLDSVRNSSYANWELCLADGSSDMAVSSFMKRHSRDARIKYKKLDKNLGISQNTNAALAMAGGDYILFADHDDLIAPDALYEIVKAVNEKGQPDVLYTDEDKVSMDGRDYFEPNFKPDYNLFRLRDNNYICHLFAVKKSLLDRVGHLDPAFDGAQDYDLILRCCEAADQVVHIPRVLYHWRCAQGSTSADPSAKRYAFEAGRRAVQAHYDRLGLAARVEDAANTGWYRSWVQIQGEPLVSIIIPTKDHKEDLALCLNSIFEKSTYSNWEVLVIDNGSSQPELLSYYEEVAAGAYRDKVRILPYDIPFNFSRINNYAVSQAKGDYLLFLNNDTEVLTPDWIEQMLMICQQEKVGAVGAKLFYPDHTIQHAGVILGLGGIAGHLYCTGSGDDPGYMGKLVSVQELSAVTAACMMMKRSAFEQAGGYDETLAVAFNDVDLCMAVRREGYKVVFTPYAQLTHYESKSRGLEDTPEKQKRFASESARFREKWGAELEAGDPYFSPNLSLKVGYCAPKGSSFAL